VHKDWRGDLLLMMGFGVGLYTFFKGLRVYREYRLLEDTPETHIRSIAMGLAHVRGTAVGEETLTSPVTHTPCFFYKVDIQKWEKDRNRSGCRHYRTDINRVLKRSNGPTSGSWGHDVFGLAPFF
jgi:hypothetical protein